MFARKSAISLSLSCLILFISLVWGILGPRAAAKRLSLPASPAIPSSPKIGTPTLAARIGQYVKLPLRFEADRGQFLARGHGYSVGLNGAEAILKLRARTNSVSTTEKDISNFQTTTAILKMSLIGAQVPSRMIGLEELPTKSHYFLGNDPAKWRTNIASFARVKVEQVYPGIDLVWYGNQQNLEHDFWLAPGADPRRIKLTFTGAEKITLDRQGNLKLTVRGGELELRKPQAWQDMDGERRKVACAFRIGKRGQVEFQLGAYDARRELVIDPVLAYSSLIGGASSDQGLDIAVDAQGAAYVTGQTTSTDFPIVNPLPGSSGNPETGEVFVTKINPAGTAIVYSTYLGGDGFDEGSSIAVDAAGNAYLCGRSASTNFPTTAGVPQGNHAGLVDGFVTKLNPAGAALVYSTLLGGNLVDQPFSLAVDASGNAYVVGQSDSTDFASVNLTNARQGSALYRSTNGGADWTGYANGMPAVRIQAVESQPGNPAIVYAGGRWGLYKSTDGGVNWMQKVFLEVAVSRIVFDPANDSTVYVLLESGTVIKSINAGESFEPFRGPIGTFGISSLAFDPKQPGTIYLGSADGMFKSVDGGASWQAINNGLTQFGIPNPPRIRQIVLDPNQPSTLYIATTRNVFKSTDAGASWAAASAGLGDALTDVRNILLDPVNSAVLYAYSLNGIYKSVNGATNWAAINNGLIPAGQEIALRINALAFDPATSTTLYAGTNAAGVYKTTDGGANWTAVKNGLNNQSVFAIWIDSANSQRVLAGADAGSDVFAGKLNAAGSQWSYFRTIGGFESDSAVAVALDSQGAAYLIGATASSNFPVLNAVQPASAGNTDGFVTKLSSTGQTLYSTYLGGELSDQPVGIGLDQAGTVVIAGTTTSRNFPLVAPFRAVPAVIPGGPPTNDGFVTKLNSQGTAWSYSSYVGSTGGSTISALAVAPSGEVYVAGVSFFPSFPVVAPIQPTPQNERGSYISQFNAAGSALLFSTFFGIGTNNPIASMTLDGAGNLYLTAGGGASTFPTLNPIPLPGTNRGTDVLVAKISAKVADLAITMTDRPDPVQVNGTLSYEVTVTNNGLDAATDVTVTDVLPDGVTFVSANASQGSCSGTRTITCALGSLALQASATITIRLTPTDIGTLTNRASVSSTAADGNLNNNIAEHQTKVSALPSIFGRVTTSDGQGVGGVTVSLSPQFRATTSDMDGYYQFGELTAGANYDVLVSKPGFTFFPVNREINNLTSDQRADFMALRCSFTVAPLNASFTATGGAGSLTVTANNPACAWTARSTVPWIRLTAGSSGTGNGAVIFTVEPTTTARRGEIVVAGQVIPLRQEFNACPQVEYQSVPQILNEGLDAGELPRFVVADFNGDGRGDPAVITLGASSSGLLLPVNVAVAFSNGGGYGAPVTVLGQTVSSASTTIPASLATADFNRDGKPDLAITRQDRVVVLLNTSMAGNGSFAAPVEIPINQALHDIFTGDFNQDGNPDIACSAIGNFPPIDKNIVVLLGNGAGGFGAPLTTLIFQRGGGDAPQLQPGDFNADGKLDVAAQVLNNEIVILRGNGAGGFELLPGIAGSSSPAQVPNRLGTGDFNADGRSDIVVLRPSTHPDGRSIAIYRSTGSGFDLTGLRSLVVDSWIGGLQTADLNSDGRSEVLVLSRNVLGVIATFENGSPLDGVYFPLPLVKSAANPGAPLTFALGDFNGDRRPDVFVPIPVGGLPGFSPPTAFAVLVGNGAIGFDAPRGFGLFTPTEPYNSLNVLAVADFNGDRVSDVLIRVVRASGTEIVVRFGNGLNGFAAQASIGTNVVALGSSDYNHDGRPDIAVLNPASGMLEVYSSDGRNGFSRIGGPMSVGVNARLLAEGDFTSDGNPDFLLAGANGVQLLAGKGDTTFNDLAASIMGNLTNITFTPGDFNGDGNLDLLALTPPPPPSTTAIVSVLFGDGQGRFSGELAQAVLAQQPQIRVADFNDDGKSDVAVASLSASPDSTPGIIIAFARGNGQFGANEGFISQDVFLAAPPLQSLSTGDVNGDGLTDLLAIARTSNQQLVYTAQAAGQFRALLSFPTAESVPPLPFVGDFNGDGAPDVLRVVPAGGASVLFNRGSCAPGGALTLTSAASFNRLRMAGESIAAAFGVNLANEVVVATTTPLPTTLGGTTLRIRDSAGVELDAPLFFVSPGQINLLVPRGLANGPAVVTVRRGGGVVATGLIEIVTVNPGLLSADATGTGSAAAVVLRVKADGAQVFEPVVQFNASQNRFDPVPIDVSNPAEQVFVLLFGTGLRNRSSLSNVSLRIGGEAAEVLYAGDQGGFAGLDQINARLLPSLAGKGDVSVELTIDGKVANTVRLRIR